MGGQERGSRANSDRRSDPIDAAKRTADSQGGQVRRMAPLDRHAKPQTRKTISTSLVSCFRAFVAILMVVTASLPARAQMGGGPASAGFKGERGTPSSPGPQSLREIGFEQHLDAPLPA